MQEDQRTVIFETRFIIVGMTLDDVPGAKQPTILDDANDQGFSIFGNAQFVTKSSRVGTENKKILSGSDSVLGFRVTSEVLRK